MNKARTATTSRLLLAMMRNVETPRRPDHGASRVAWYQRANAPMPNELEYAKVAHVAVLGDG